MKNIRSLFSCVVVSVALVICRFIYSDFGNGTHLNITTWDALGYYMYLPATFIYHDATELKWLPAIEQKYKVQGGELYQAQRCKQNGNYVFKYLGGVAILQTPFFFLAHFIATHSRYAADGFSPPYQYAVALGILFYFICSLFLLRKILLRWFSDTTVALTILLLVLATNAIQSAAVDTGMSHAPIFPLYVLLLYATIKWHNKPTVFSACATGYLIGLATISRPTEAIMLFIPLLWNTQSKTDAQLKWTLVKQHLSHVSWAVIGGFAGVLPQLLYWKFATGSFVYDVGSKWVFLNPYFRVLFGWEKGWFIYTPVTLFFVAGLFFIKKYPFAKSVIWFCVLNIYIIISWSDWKYGGSYTTRALVQSYPVFAFALAAFVQHISGYRWRYLFYGLAVYLTAVNLFQIYQYNQTIIHSYDMNRRYYCRVYLNPSPTPLDMSLLDTDEFIYNENEFESTVLVKYDTFLNLKPVYAQPIELAKVFVEPNAQNTWFKAEAVIYGKQWLWGTYLNVKSVSGDSVKQNRARLFNGISAEGKDNGVALYFQLPTMKDSSTVTVSLSSDVGFEGDLKSLKVTRLSTR